MDIGDVGQVGLNVQLSVDKAKNTDNANATIPYHLTADRVVPG